MKLKAALVCSLALVLLSACPKKKDEAPPAPTPTPAASAQPADPVIAKDAPRVVATMPANGSKGVPASIETISVAFNKPMNNTSWAFVKEKDETAPPVTGQASFDDMGRVASMPVKLEPGKEYVVWINHKDQLSFKDISGKPVAPYRLSFTTAGTPKPGNPQGKVLVDGKLAAAAAPPRVVATDPANGAKDVDPAKGTISVTFDRPMKDKGWSWVKENDQSFPEGLGQPSFDASMKTNSIKVKLKPKTSYVIWINSDKFKHFQDEKGAPATPYKLSFTTK